MGITAFPCEHCGASFKSENRLKEHKRERHQLLVEIRGVERAVERADDGYFLCPHDGCPGFSTRIPKTLQQHYYKAHPSPDNIVFNGNSKRLLEEECAPVAKRTRSTGRVDDAATNQGQLGDHLQPELGESESPGLSGYLGYCASRGTHSTRPEGGAAVAADLGGLPLGTSLDDVVGWERRSDVSDTSDSAYSEGRQVRQEDSQPSFGFYTDNSDDVLRPSESRDADLAKSREANLAKLKEADIAVDKTFNVAICQGCRCGILAPKIKGHVINTHGTAKTLPDDLETIVRDLGIRRTPDPPESLIRPLPFIEVVQGWRCVADGCSYACRTESTALSHVGTAHPRKNGHGPARSMLMPWPVQNVYHSPMIFWAVDLSHSSKIDMTQDIRLMMQGLRTQERNIKSNIIMIPNNNRIVHPLLVLLGWDTLADGKDGDVLRALVAGSAGTEWKAVRNLNKLYFDRARPIVNDFCPHSLFWIASPILNEKAKLPFRVLQNESSRDQYERMGELVVCFALRVHDRSPLPVLFGSKQRKRIRALHHLLKSADSAQSECLAAYHKVLAALCFSIHPEIDMNKKKEFWNLFIFCANVGGENGTFRSSHSIASTCSMLVYLIRCVAIYRLHEQWKKLALPRNTSLLELTRKFRTSWLVQEEGNTPIGVVRHISHLSSNDAFAERAPPSVQWTVLHRKLSVRGHVVDLDKFPTMFQSGVADGFEKLKKLGRGASIKLTCRLEELVDDNLSRSHGYSFLANHNYRMEDMRYCVVDHLANNGFLNSADGQLQWNRLELSTWMREAQALNELIMVLVHIMTQPPRMQELYTVTIRNQHTSARSVFVVGGRIQTIIGYSKGQSQDARLHQIPRHAPALLSHLIILYLIFIRTVEELFAKTLWGDKAYEVLRYELFYRQGGLSCSDHDSLSTVLKGYFGMHLNAPIGVADYRHLATAIGRDLLGVVEDNVDFTTGMDAGAGRCTTTSNRVYGIPTEQLGMLSTKQIAFHLTIDDLWQTGLLGLPPRTNLGSSWKGDGFFSSAIMQNIMHEMKNELLKSIHAEFAQIREEILATSTSE